MSDYGLRRGTADVKSAGPITFGPEGILFVADNRSAKVYAIDTAEPGAAAGAEPFDLDNVDVRVASFLGCDVGDIVIKDMAVHPRTHNVYLSVQRGRGDAAQPVFVRVDRLDGTLSEFALTGVSYAEVAIEDAPSLDDERLDTTLPLGAEGEELKISDGRTIHVLRQPIRTATVTDMAYAEGVLLVAGLSNEEFSSKLRRIPFPFGKSNADNGLEIFHVSHGKWETAAPIRTFIPYEGGRSILASYTCTPLVHFAIDDLQPGARVVGRTVAELGPVNQPLDMVLFEQDGEEHVLVANSSHGLLKVACRDIDAQEALTEPKEPIGIPRETEDLQGVVRMANLNGSHVLVLQRDAERRHHLRSLKTASL